MPKYKCSNPNCKNKSKADSPGFCPECGTRLKKESNAILFLLIGGGSLLIILILIGVLLAAGSGNITTNHSNNISPDKPTKNVSTTPISTNQIFENQYIKFEYPKGWAVTDNPKNGKMHVDIKNSNIENGALFVYPINDWQSNNPGIEPTLQNVYSTSVSENNYKVALSKVTVAGTEGLEGTPLSYNNIHIANYVLYFQKGTNFYVLDLPTTNYDADKAGIDLIIQSLQFK